MVSLDAETKERMREMRPTLEELRLIDIRRDYKVLRGRYFGDHIPDVREVSILFLPSNGVYAGCYFSDYTLHYHAILLDGKSNLTETRLTLLHEMAHLSVDLKWKRYMQHGKHWQAEMKRLAKAGAFEDWW